MLIMIKSFIAAVAQSVEQRTENPRVISSILIGGTEPCFDNINVQNRVFLNFFPVDRQYPENKVIIHLRKKLKLFIYIHIQITFNTDFAGRSMPRKNISVVCKTEYLFFERRND